MKVSAPRFVKASIELLALVVVALAQDIPGDVLIDSGLSQSFNSKYCETYNTQQSCHLNCACGWCDDSRCVPGDIKGPLAGSCDQYLFDCQREYIHANMTVFAILIIVVASLAACCMVGLWKYGRNAQVLAIEEFDEEEAERPPALVLSKYLNHPTVNLVFKSLLPQFKRETVKKET